MTPLNQVQEYMGRTYAMRKAQLKISENLSDTLDHWPRLLDITGMVLF